MPNVPAPDPYAVLGVNRDATPEQIKAAHRRRSKDTHPDTGGSEADFSRVQAAYELLRDAKRRERYDTTGDASETTPDKSDQMAYAVIDGLLVQVMQQDEEPFHTDLPSAMIDAIRERVRALSSQALKLERARRRAVRMLDRFTRKRGAGGEPAGDNVLDGMVKWHVEGLKEAQIKIAEEKKTMQRAIELLRDYDFRTDPTPGFSTYLQGDRGFGSGATQSGPLGGLGRGFFGF